jgi:predicted adenylyl cyclase CyaB
MDIEVGVRSLISKEKYDELLKFFSKVAKPLGEDYQETHYLDREGTLRIQRNNNFSKIWLKKGKLHDEQREEMEVRFDRNDFEKLENLLLSLGYKVCAKWFRKRNSFDWNGVNVMVDYTKGYGYILELEKRATEENKDSYLSLLNDLGQEILRTSVVG